MKTFRIATAPILVASVALSSCASIFNRTPQGVNVTSQPSGLTYQVTDKNGVTVGQGTTPGSLMLEPSTGYFKGAAYTFTFSDKGKVVGTQVLNSSVTGWYAGNILFGGIIGLLIVDPLTGAMYALPDDVHFGGQPVASFDNGTSPSLAVASIGQLTPAQRGHLVRL